MTTTIKAGETIYVTSKRTGKGQIILDKSGVETGSDLWNDNSLAGNTFAIPTGEIVQK